MRITKYDIYTSKPHIDITATVVADLHSHNGDRAIELIKQLYTDILLSPGDMLERLDGPKDERNTAGFDFLYKASGIAPLYYVFGNHELCGGHREIRKIPTGSERISRDNANRLKKDNIILINDEYKSVFLPKKSIGFSTSKGILHIGGLMSGSMNEGHMPNIEFAEKFSRLDGFKLLLCHHPEYYEKFLCKLDIDLIISGHAHGGQWRIFGRGIYAPDQGLFPKYTSGLHDNRLLISRGMCNNAYPIPRIFNPCEILSVHIKSL